MIRCGPVDSMLVDVVTCVVSSAFFTFLSVTFFSAGKFSKLESFSCFLDLYKQRFIGYSLVFSFKWPNTVLQWGSWEFFSRFEGKIAKLRGKLSLETRNKLFYVCLITWWTIELLLVTFLNESFIILYVSLATGVKTALTDTSLRFRYFLGGRIFQEIIFVYTCQESLLLKCLILS